MNKALIAVIDDEQDLLDNFTDLLSDQYEIRSFIKPTDFLTALPDLIKNDMKMAITDYKMPGMTGLEMMKRAYDIKGFPFIVLSGQLDKQTVLDAVEIGVFRILEKPCDYDSLAAAIDQLLLEGDLIEVRKEIRMLTSQLRELYSMIRIALMQYIPEETIDRMVVDAPNGNVKEKMSFEDLLEKLEHRLETLLVSEKMLADLKTNKWKAG